MVVFPFFLSLSSGLFHVMGQVSGALRCLRVLRLLGLLWLSSCLLLFGCNFLIACWSDSPPSSQVTSGFPYTSVPHRSPSLPVIRQLYQFFEFVCHWGILLVTGSFSCLSRIVLELRTWRVFHLLVTVYVRYIEVFSLLFHLWYHRFESS